MNLTGKQKNYLRGVAHSMNPVVMIGAKGLTEAVLSEIELALEQHELIKIKLPSNSKAEKAALIAQISATTSSEPVQIIGRVGVLYRANDEAKIMLPTV